MTTSEPARKTKRASRARRMATVEAVDTLVGAHPVALRDLYQDGTQVDATLLGGERPARILAIEPLEPAFFLTRRLVRSASKLMPWRGKRFESGGTAGRDLILGKPAFRFRVEVGPSALDGRPTLRLAYDGLKNPWPISTRVDEMRRVGETIAVGVTSMAPTGRPRVTYWWGMDVPAEA